MKEYRKPENGTLVIDVHKQFVWMVISRKHGFHLCLCRKTGEAKVMRGTNYIERHVLISPTRDRVQGDKDT
jgi:hypothetical protein